MAYGFGNSGNSQFEQPKQTGNKFTNGVNVNGQGISPQVYKQLVARATKMGYTLEQFLKVRAQTMQFCGMEPEQYYVAKQVADQHGINIKMFTPYIQRGINDLKFALQDLMNKGLIANVVPGTGMAVEPVVSGIEEMTDIQVVKESSAPLQQPNGQVQQIQIPENILNPMGNQDCNPSNMPIGPAGDPANNPNTYNQEPLQKIGDGLNPPKPQVQPENVQYSQEIIALSQKYQIHPSTLVMLQKNASHFKGITLDEYIQIAISANKEGISVLQYYTIYMKNNKRSGSSINSKIKQEAGETDIIVGDLMNQARAIQQQNQPNQPTQAEVTGGVGKKVAYGQSKLDAGSIQEGGFIGSTNIDQDYQQTAYGNGIESKKELTQPVFGASEDKDVKVGEHRTIYGNGVSGTGNKQRVAFGTN